MSVWNYTENYESSVPEEFRVSLGEGNTPLIRSRSIGPSVGLENLFFKLESGNPTGSYKDRFAAPGISHMKQNGDHTCLATSSGNTGAALAAYCAAARIRCRIAVVETAPIAKLQQMLAYGAEIERVRGFGPDAAVTQQVIEALHRKAEEPGHALQVSAFHWSPLGMEGVQSIAYELNEQMEKHIDHVFSPAGGGGLTLAVARGFSPAYSTAVHCVQPEGNDTIASALRSGLDKAMDVECTTKISGLQVANVIDGHEVIAACRKSGGTGHLVSDEEVYAAQKRLAREEGIFSEPAGAVALAGILNASKHGDIAPSARVVALVTGSGFKDAHSIESMNAGNECPLVEPDQLFS
jgi:threonine synthase